MEKEKWTETRKEAEIDSEGNIIVKKVTLEKQKKMDRRELTDYIIKVIGLFSIGIPLIIFFLNHKSSQEKQVRDNRLEIYSSTIADLHQFSYLNPFSPNYEEKAAKILNETYPKTLLLGDKKVLDEFEKFNHYIEFCIQNNSFSLKTTKINSAIINYNPKNPYEGIDDDLYYLEYQKENLNEYNSSKNSLVRKQVARIYAVTDSMKARIKLIKTSGIGKKSKMDRGPEIFRKEFQKQFQNEYQKFTKNQVQKISLEIKNTLDHN